MPSFLLGEAERLHAIGEKIPALAIAFEGKLVALSRRYVESLWRLKAEQLVRELDKEYYDNPILFFADTVLPTALRGYQIERHRGGGGYSAEDYLKSRNLYVESTLHDALEIIDYLDYDDLLEYLRFFTKVKVDSAVEYGKGLAKDSHKKHKTRMDGTTLPEYPPIVVRAPPIVKPKLVDNTQIEEDKKEQSKPKKPQNVF